MQEKTPIEPLSRQLLYEDVAQRIGQLVAERRLWNSYLPPERELAELFEVNRGTIRKGLALLEEQGVVRRQQGCGTRVLPKARAKGERKEARVVVASLMHLPSGAPFYALITAGLTQGASNLPWHLVFHSQLSEAERWADFINCLAQGDMDGVLLLSVTERGPIEELLRHWTGPTVIVDHYYSDLPVTGVIDDSRAGARAAMEHLLELGHRRIGYLGVTDPATNPWRLAGYTEALQAAGIKPDPQLEVTCRGNIEAGRAAAEKLLALPDSPTALLAFDDRRAWGAWQAAEARGLEVGRDIAIVGYGDVPPPTGYPVEMTTVRIDPLAMGELAVHELDKLIQGESRPGELVITPAELIVRKSSRDARPRTRSAGGTS